jgi:hypothetical protein
MERTPMSEKTYFKYSSSVAGSGTEHQSTTLTYLVEVATTFPTGNERLTGHARSAAEQFLLIALPGANPSALQPISESEAGGLNRVQKVLDRHKDGGVYRVG